MKRTDLIVGVVCVVLGVVGIAAFLCAFSHYAWWLALGGGVKAEKAMVFCNLGPAVPYWFLWLFPLVLFFFRHEAKELLGKMIDRIAAE